MERSGRVRIRGSAFVTLGGPLFVSPRPRRRPVIVPRPQQRRSLIEVAAGLRSPFQIEQFMKELELQKRLAACRPAPATEKQIRETCRVRLAELQGRIP